MYATDWRLLAEPEKEEEKKLSIPTDSLLVNNLFIA